MFLEVVLGAADKIEDAVDEGAGDVGEQQIAPGARPAARRPNSKEGASEKRRPAGVGDDVRRPRASARKAGKRDSTPTEEGSENKLTPISRTELLEKALRIVATDLEIKGGERPTNTIGSLVQLLKLDRSFREDEEQPHEIRVVWQEKKDETLDDSTAPSAEN